MEYTSLSTAVLNYQKDHKDDQAFEKLGKGSLGSWKVTVLLHNQKDNTWKFEDANIFKRVFWKIAKYVPFLKSSYEKVNLDQIHAALKTTEQSPEAIILMGRVEQLWQMKKPGKTEGQQQVTQQQPSQKDVKTPLAAKPTEQASIQKDLSVGQLSVSILHHQGYDWIVPPGAKVEKMEHNQFKVTVGEKSVVLQPGKFSGHGEYTMKERLEKKNQVDEKLCHISNDGSTPDLMLKTDEGKIRVYQGPAASAYQTLIYQEYNSVEEAVKDYKRLPVLDNLLFLRSRIGAVEAKYEMAWDGIKNAVKELVESGKFSLNQNKFLTDLAFVDTNRETPEPILPVHRETLNKWVDQELTNQHAVEVKA